MPVVSTNSMLRIFGDPHSENGTITWQPEPLSRGTWSILSTCTLTMFLCVWTAVHLNVPPPESTVRAFLRKTRWLILGLFAPELVVFTAWSQYKAARWTANSLNKSKNNTREPTEHSTPLEKKTSWAFWRNKSQGRSSEQPKVVSTSAQMCDWFLTNYSGLPSMDSTSIWEASLLILELGISFFLTRKIL